MMKAIIPTKSLTKCVMLMLTMLLVSLPLSAQELSVKSFELLTNDATAKDEQYQRVDGNGNLAGLVKVVIAKDGVEFDGGMIIDKKKWNMSEYWVWMADGATKLTVLVPGFQPLEINFRDYDFKMLHSKNTYKLVVNVTEADDLFQEGVSVKSADSGTLSVTVKGVSFKMVRVEGGSFQMGATEEQGSETENSEKPAHSVTLDGFMIGETEVTQALWKAVMGDNPATNKGARNPVENVSWDECQEFITKLNELTGLQFRLPTEAEWEFAARGGNKSQHYRYSGSNTIDNVAWFADNCEGSTHAVASKRSNELGLYDMTGNVWEWCEDKYGTYSTSPQTNPKGPETGPGNFRMFRGGSWGFLAKDCRLSRRVARAQDFRNSVLGLRLALPASENIELANNTTATDNLDNREDVSGFGRSETFTVKGVAFKMVLVKSGTFQMGATAEQGDGEFLGERPVHDVTLSDYMIGETEVTQELWEAVMGSNPSIIKSKKDPVECVSWNDCQNFITKLNALTGQHFRLPTEAEWEFAARGGIKSQHYKYSGSNTLDEVAWYADNGGKKVHCPVGTKKKNELGIYDMSGNVWEWCEDWNGMYSDSAQTNPKGPDSDTQRLDAQRLLRGGCVKSEANDCRVSRRGAAWPNITASNIGFRLAL